MRTSELVLRGCKGLALLTFNVPQEEGGGDEGCSKFWAAVCRYHDVYIPPTVQSKGRYVAAQQSADLELAVNRAFQLSAFRSSFEPLMITARLRVRSPILGLLSTQRKPRSLLQASCSFSQSGS